MILKCTKCKGGFAPSSNNQRNCQECRKDGGIPDRVTVPKKLSDHVDRQRRVDLALKLARTAHKAGMTRLAEQYMQYVRIVQRGSDVRRGQVLRVFGHGFGEGADRCSDLAFLIPGYPRKDLPADQPVSAGQRVENVVILPADSPNPCRSCGSAVSGRAKYGASWGDECNRAEDRVSALMDRLR